MVTVTVVFDSIDVADAQLFVEGHIVVGREDIFIGELPSWQAHELHKALGDAVDCPGFADGGDDLHPARAFDDHRTAVQVRIVDAHALLQRASG